MGRRAEIGLNLASLTAAGIAGGWLTEYVLLPASGRTEWQDFGAIGYAAATLVSVSAIGYSLWRGFTHPDLPPFRPPFNFRPGNLKPDGYEKR